MHRQFGKLTHDHVKKPKMCLVHHTTVVISGRISWDTFNSGWTGSIVSWHFINNSLLNTRLFCTDSGSLFGWEWCIYFASPLYKGLRCNRSVFYINIPKLTCQTWIIVLFWGFFFSHISDANLRSGPKCLGLLHSRVLDSDLNLVRWGDGYVDIHRVCLLNESYLDMSC